MELYPYDEWTGQRIGWIRTADYDPEKGGPLFRRLMKQPGKKLQTPEAQKFLEYIRSAGEHVDPLVPWLANQFKRGELRYMPYAGATTTDEEGNIVPDETPWLHRKMFDNQYTRVGPNPLDKWAEWYNAREHPTRRGVNVEDPNFDVKAMMERTLEHQRALEEERERQRLIERMQDSTAQVVHTFPNGYTVRKLESEDLADESDVLGHCIGRDARYGDWLDDGSIEAYSLRDPDGIPKATWHYNHDGSLAHVQGESGDPKAEYMDMIEDWSIKEDKPTEVEGEKDPVEYVDEVHVGEVGDIGDWLSLIRYYDDDYEVMEQHLGPNQEFSEYGATPIWHPGKHLMPEIMETLISDPPQRSWQREIKNSLKDLFFGKDPLNIDRSQHVSDLDKAFQGMKPSDFEDGDYERFAEIWNPFREKYVTPENPEPDWNWIDRNPYQGDWNWQTREWENSVPERSTPLDNWKWENWPKLFEGDPEDPVLWQENPRWQEPVTSSTLYPYDEWTGQCIGWIRIADYDPEKGGINYRRLMKQPGKKLMTPEAQEFLSYIRGAGESVDPLVPWLANQYKRGELRLLPLEVHDRWEQDEEGNMRQVKKSVPTLHRRNPLFDPEADAIDPSLPPEPEYTKINSVHGLSPLQQWSEWYNAREHPTRRGVNVQDPSFGINEITNASSRHQQALEEERERQEQIEMMRGSQAPVVHTFPDGWTVRQLGDREDAFLEGEIMDHCIGSDCQPNEYYNYGDAIEAGVISAYSLRDPDGIPHMTWHYNPDGSLADVNGTGNQTPRDDYYARFKEWSEKTDKPTNPVGDSDWASPYDDEATVSLNSAADFINLFGEHSDESNLHQELYNWAVEEGANFNPEAYEDPSINLDIDYDAIAKDLVQHGNPVAAQKYLDRADRRPQGIRDQDGKQLELFEDDRNYHQTRRPYAINRLDEIWEAINEQGSGDDGGYDFPSSEDHMSDLAHAIKRLEVDPQYKEEHASVLDWLDNLSREWTYPPGYSEEAYYNKGLPMWGEIADIGSGYQDHPPEETALNDPTYAPPLWSDDFYIRPQDREMHEELPQHGNPNLPWWWPSNQTPYSAETTNEDDTRFTDGERLPIVAHSVWNKA